MPWLRHHPALVTVSKKLQESARPSRIELEGWGQLQEQRPQLIAQSSDLFEKSLERLARAHQQSLMGDQLGHLHREFQR